jgi:hypothetical protein
MIRRAGREQLERERRRRKAQPGACTGRPLLRGAKHAAQVGAAACAARGQLLPSGSGPLRPCVSPRGHSHVSSTSTSPSSAPSCACSATGDRSLAGRQWQQLLLLLLLGHSGRWARRVGRVGAVSGSRRGAQDGVGRHGARHAQALYGSSYKVLYKVMTAYKGCPTLDTGHATPAAAGSPATLAGYDVMSQLEPAGMQALAAGHLEQRDVVGCVVCARGRRRVGRLGVPGEQRV